MRKRTMVGAAVGLGVAGAATAAAVGAGAAYGAWRLWRKFDEHGQEDLHGQVALITGGSRGLGLQLARDLAAQGCKLALCARDAAGSSSARGTIWKSRRGGVDCTV